MTFDTIGEADLRGVMYDSDVKNIAMRLFKFKQAVTEDSTSVFNNYFYREVEGVLSDPSGNASSKIPRGAAYPRVSASWEQINTVIGKYGCEEFVFMEDIRFNNIDVMTRTMAKIAERVAKSVDTEIWNGLTENRSPTNIQTVTIAANYEWTTASAAIIDDLEQAEQLIAEYDHPTDNLMVFINPAQKRYIVKFLYDKGAQAPQTSERMINGSGVIGKLGNKTFIVSNEVTASYALMVVPKLCGTWKVGLPLTTWTKNDAGKGDLVRAAEIGTFQLHAPKACVLITNTGA